MILMLAVAGGGFLTTLVLSRWVSGAAIAVVLGTVIPTAAAAAGLGVYYANRAISAGYGNVDPGTPEPAVSIYMLLFLALAGAAVGRWLADRRKPLRAKSASKSAHTPV